MKTMLFYILFSTLFTSGITESGTPVLEDSKIINDLNKAELSDWTIGNIESNPFENEKLALLPTPVLEANLNAKTEKLDDQCYENVHLQFFTLDQKEELYSSLKEYEGSRTLLFPTIPEIMENDQYLVLVWKPFCLSDANYSDDRMEGLISSFENKLNLKLSDSL